MPLPRCLHCGAELPGVALFTWQYPPFVIMCVYCPDERCRKVIHLQIVSVMDGAVAQGLLTEH
jgi:hypothetical protein